MGADEVVWLWLQIRYYKPEWDGYVDDDASMSPIRTHVWSIAISFQRRYKVFQGWLYAITDIDWITGSNWCEHPFSFVEQTLDSSFSFVEQTDIFQNSTSASLKFENWQIGCNFLSIKALKLIHIIEWDPGLIKLMIPVRYLWLAPWRRYAAAPLTCVKWWPQELLYWRLEGSSVRPPT